MSDLERIRGGEGVKFDGTLAKIFRVDELYKQSNFHSRNPTPEGLHTWLATVHAIYREIYPYLTPEEILEIESVAVKNIDLAGYGPNPLNAWRQNWASVDRFEKKVRVLAASKNFDATAKEANPTSILDM